MSVIGILALQGAFQAHMMAFRTLDLECILIKKLEDLKEIDGIVLPGGESTTTNYLLHKHSIYKELSKIVREIPVLATCAGTILLQQLGVLDIEIERNGYGGQLASGIHSIECYLYDKKVCIDGHFIRAPIIRNINDSQVKVMSTYKGSPVLIQKNDILALTFHTELSQDLTIHKYFKNCIIS